MLLDITKQGDVISIRLSTGEEMLGTLVKEAAGNLEVSKPMIVARSPDGNMGLIPFMVTTNSEKYTLSLTHVMAYAKTQDEIAKLYSEQTSSILR